MVSWAVKNISIHCLLSHVSWHVWADSHIVCIYNTLTTWYALLKINKLYDPNMTVTMEHCFLQYYWIWWLTPAYANILGNLARFPVPSAYTFALIKTSFSTCKLERECHKHGHCWLSNLNIGSEQSRNRSKSKS